MKTKLTSLLALVCVLNINAAEQASTFSGNASVGYTSDYFYRGEQISEDALQLGVGASAKFNDLRFCAKILTNQPDTGNDFTLVTAGVGASFFEELLDLYVGVQNRKVDTDGSELDVFIGAKANIGIDTTVVLYRNIDDDLYTIEGTGAYTFDLSVVDLTVEGLVGSTEELSNDRTYYGGTLTVSRDIGGLTVEAGGSLIDSDESSLEETVFAGLALKF